jgi:tetratricopeptide (TPR) repeat protein
MKKFFNISRNFPNNPILVSFIFLILGLMPMHVEANKASFYILDSTRLDELSEYDKNLLDSCLSVFHSTEVFEEKLEAISYMLYDLDNEDLIIRYANWFLKENKLFFESKHSDSIVLKNISRFFLSAGYANWIIGNTKEALHFANKAIAKLSKISDKRLLAQAYNNKASALTDLGDDIAAIDYLFEALKIHEELKDTNGLALIFHNIAYSYGEIEDYDNALEFYYKSYTYYLLLEDEEELGMTFNNIGLVYFNQGRIDSAMYYYNRALDVYTKYNKESSISTAVSNMGKIYQQKGAYENALKYFETSLEIDQRLGLKRDVCIALNNIGYMYSLIKKYDKAIYYSSQSMEISVANNYLSSIKYAAENLSTAYEKSGNYEKALHYFRMFKDYSDSTSKTETQRKFAEFKMKMEFHEQAKSDSIYQIELERIENEALAEEQLKRERRDNLQYSGILILFLILFVFISYGNKINLPTHLIRGMIFLGILMFFEFILVLLDPYIESISDNAPGIKLALNASIASVFFPIHRLLEAVSKEKLVKKRKA